MISWNAPEDSVMVCFLCVTSLLAVGAAAPPRSEAAMMAILRKRQWYGTEFILRLTVADTGETFTRKGKVNAFEHLALKNCFAANGKGAFTAVLRFPETDEEITLRTAGLAEDFYLVHILGLQKPFAKWLARARGGVKPSPDVAVGPRRERTKDAKAIDAVPPYLLGAVGAAAVKYEEKRAELFLRVRRHSHLYFPPAEKTQWRVIRDGDRLFVETGCSDRMYFAVFDIEFRKVGGDGEWEYVRMSCEERFKGE
jgi:hypothetical protein